ncbi:MAG TPA: DUF488 family protein [Puia sp.]|jgi:uncharacterized protein YeaO (DUF488 family)|nr:DUF488 family protein [Puia sp.]
MPTAIRIRRIYDLSVKEDGYRVLVDRLWPRGIKKEAGAFDEWAKDLAPSADLRKWFDHDPQHWPEFQKRYREELKANEAVKEFVKAHAGKKTITLLYAAKSEEYNHAIILQEYLRSGFKTADSHK